MLSLYVGDPHVKVSNLAESESLLKFVRESAVQYNVDRIVILGDLFHTHSLVRLEVLEFWRAQLFALSLTSKEVIVLCGNHDQTGDYGSKTNALSIFKDLKLPNLTIVDSPMRFGAIAYAPYIHHQEEFLREVNALANEGAKTLVCHQTFSGAKYDNGMFAPDGFDPENVNYTLIISGHIHSSSRFGKVIYPGTATWQTASDANKDKGIWLVEHDDAGAIVFEQVLDTSKIVQPIYSISWKEGDDQPTIPEGRITLELIGTSAWINQQKPNFKGKISLKTKITDKSENRVRKQTASITEFLSSFKSPVSTEDLLNAMKEFVLV
jgi:DNA repair exonuclease SbcCD nuclease subunit